MTGRRDEPWVPSTVEGSGSRQDVDSRGEVQKTVEVRESRKVGGAKPTEIPGGPGGPEGGDVRRDRKGGGGGGQGVGGRGGRDVTPDVEGPPSSVSTAPLGSFFLSLSPLSNSSQGRERDPRDRPPRVQFLLP